MIQDIAPHKYHVDYKNKKAEQSDKVIPFFDGKLIVRKAETLDFMKYDETPEKYKSSLQFLFTIDVEDFFLAIIDEETANTLLEGDYQYIGTRGFMSLEPAHYAFAAATTLQLARWYMNNRYCGACRTELVHDDKERMLKCPSCNNTVYPRINPAVIIAVINGDSILLTKYQGTAYTHYALVAGFVEIGESFEDTVRREVMEETGLHIKNIRYYGSQPWAFADDILAGYICEVDGDTKITIEENELSEAIFVPRDEIPDVSPDISLTNTMIYGFKVGEYK